jgi:hypothetical protein
MQRKETNPVSGPTSAVAADATRDEFPRDSWELGLRARNPGAGGKGLFPALPSLSTAVDRVSFGLVNRQRSGSALR